MFAYLISKLLCNIYQSLDVRSDKLVLLWNELKHRLDWERPWERPTWKAFWNCWSGKIIFYVFIVIWIAFITRSEVVSRKVLNGLNRKISLWKALWNFEFWIILPLTLRNALRKSRRKLFAYLITVKIKPHRDYRHLNWPIRCLS